MNNNIRSIPKDKPCQIKSWDSWELLDCLSHGQGTPAATFWIAVIATDASRLPAWGSTDMGTAGLAPTCFGSGFELIGNTFDSSLSWAIHMAQVQAALMAIVFALVGFSRDRYSIRRS